jgi:hypothetical protein
MGLLLVKPAEVLLSYTGPHTRRFSRPICRSIWVLCHVVGCPRKRPYIKLPRYGLL